MRADRGLRTLDRKSFAAGRELLKERAIHDCLPRRRSTSFQMATSSWSALCVSIGVRCRPPQKVRQEQGLRADRKECHQCRVFACPLPSAGESSDKDKAQCRARLSLGCFRVGTVCPSSVCRWRKNWLSPARRTRSGGGICFQIQLSCHIVPLFHNCPRVAFLFHALTILRALVKLESRRCSPKPIASNCAVAGAAHRTKRSQNDFAESTSTRPSSER